MGFDIQLFEQMKNGEQRAFSICYQRLSPTIYSTVLRICHCRSTAQDILQETFIQAFNSLDSLNEPENFIPWCKKISYNKTISWLRKNEKYQQTVLADTQDLIDNSDIHFTIEQQSTLTRIMLRVPPQTRLILWLYIAEGYTHEELGALFERSPSYSKSIVSRTLSSISKTQLENPYANGS
ncbi:sigma-70 family RNA polymerase sigma factor [Psychrobium sp. MM17-31]|uniref:RNA polymerase sigma factor n=1 Tax=Psychrobium sp. MM17-31 TaxID=2917758 RepID=UPI001EF5CDEE|nr:sigma-70 family RNA polymerase sigma factor [Psychrobium sp. MM17-31]MCG7533328.1 sigma-70 family RNA polymerase sigma factor [Psychrobium sp. MM17-31]